MSVYPQTQAYGQTFPPPTGYPQHVSQPPNFFAPHVPPPLYHVDPSTFRRDYSSRLNELTINSRPLIQDLVMLAQSQSRYAEVVAQCIESHIRRVSLPSSPDLYCLPLPSAPLYPTLKSRVILSLTDAKVVYLMYRSVLFLVE